MQYIAICWKQANERGHHCQPSTLWTVLYSGHLMHCMWQVAIWHMDWVRASLPIHILNISEAQFLSFFSDLKKTQNINSIISFPHPNGSSYAPPGVCTPPFGDHCSREPSTLASRRLTTCGKKTVSQMLGRLVTLKVSFLVQSRWQIKNTLQERGRRRGLGRRGFRYLRKRKQNSHLPPSGVPKQQPTPTAQPTVRTSE